MSTTTILLALRITRKMWNIPTSSHSTLRHLPVTNTLSSHVFLPLKRPLSTPSFISHHQTSFSRFNHSFTTLWQWQKQYCPFHVRINFAMNFRGWGFRMLNHEYDLNYMLLFHSCLIFWYWSFIMTPKKVRPSVHLLVRNTFAWRAETRWVTNVMYATSF